MDLRPYQIEAVNKVMWELERGLDGNPVLALATGAGKSLVIAEIARRLNRPVLIIQPSREILQQNLEKLLRHVSREEVGVYSAAMNEKTIGKFTLATIQSIYTKPDEFAHFGLVIVDECHLLNPKDTGTMFQTFLREIGSPKVIGLTATPWRMDTMYVPGSGFMGRDFELVTTTKVITRMKGMFWKRILINVTMEDLISAGYLCRPRYYNNASIKHADIPMNKSRSDFDVDAYEKLVQRDEHKILDAVRRAQEVSKSVLVFCTSVEQAERFESVVSGSRSVSAKTKAKDRAAIVSGFKDHSIKTVFNVGCFTTGFDHPALDCIILNRPTRSIGLYTQMVGRGVRIAPGKVECKVIDFTGTVGSLGRVETIRVVKRDKWELESETGSWHCKELYRF
jgi:DNA repair protein RadD